MVKKRESRLYSGTQDLQSMIDLLAAVRPADRFTDYPSLVDLHEELASPRVQAQTRLWFDAGELVAFALVDAYSNLCFEFETRSADPDLESAIVAWGVSCVRRAMKKEDGAQRLDAGCRRGDGERIALLKRHGFARQEMETLHMVRSLDEPIPAPRVPPGFAIRRVAGEHEIKALVTLHRAAFGTEKMTVEQRLAMMRVPEYELELDLLAVAPDGRLAATCMCSISQEENARTGRKEGYTDPVATHPDFQRRGLARALLLTGFQKLRERGMDTAVLHTSSSNRAMLKTAQSAGYRVKWTKLWFAKPVMQPTSRNL